MDALRSLAMPLIRKNDRSTDSTMPTTTFIVGSHNLNRQNSRITLPFSAMNPEQLLGCLTNCNLATISQLWLPAMRIQIQKMVALLHDAGEIKLETSLNQIALNKVRQRTQCFGIFN
jgi:hypothetical protein